MSQGELPESVVECTAERLVVRLNRAPFRRYPLRLAAAVVVGLGVLSAALAVLLEDHISPLHAGLIWLLMVVILLRNLLFDLTLIADRPQGRVWLESRSILRARSRRKQICSVGETRSIVLRNRVDLEGEPQPYELHEIHADTRSGEVVLCGFGDLRTAKIVGETLARLLDCEWRSA